MSSGGIPGENGYSTAIVSIYKNNTSVTIPPTTNISGNFIYNFTEKTLVADTGANFNGWSTSLPTSIPGQYVWVRQGTAFSNTATDTIPAEDFSGAVCLFGIGLPGQDGPGREYIFRRTQLFQIPSVSTISKHTPARLFENDEFIPIDWTDDVTGVDKDYPYEWCTDRKKIAGIWQPFNPTPYL